jgi:hypothetical protein
MQAYQSTPCPHCRATWNRPDAKFCHDCHGQLTVAATGKSFVKPLMITVGLALFLLAIAELAVVPALVSSSISEDQRALDATFSHQASVDASLKLFLTHYDAKTKTGGVTSFTRLQSQFQSSLNTVRSDKQQIEQTDQSLLRLRFAALGKQAEIDRHHSANQVVLAALKQAEGGLVAAVDQSIVVASIDKTNGFFAQMSDASKAGDYTRMATLYPDADRALLPAESSSLGPDMPLAVRQSVHSIRALLGDDEALALAVINHDAVAGHAAYVATLADIKINANYGPSFISQWEDWNIRNVGPMLSAYDQGIGQARSAS